MECAKCGLDVPTSATLCPKCGSVEFDRPAVIAKKGLNPIIYGIAALALLAIVALVIVAMGRGKNVTSAPGGVDVHGPNITTAPPGQPGPSGIITAPPGQPAPPDRTPPGATKPKPPQEVIDYLAYVKKVEEHRQMLLKDTGEALMLSAAGGSSAKGLMDMIDWASDPDGKAARDPLADSKAELNRQYKNWLDTLKFFDNKPAPPECREFSGAYRATLYNEAKAIGDIAVDFNKVNVMDPSDMSKLLGSLQKMKGDDSIQANIDKSADDADTKLTTLVSYYDMEKPFDVPREKKGGNIMGF
jgi:hypothetical protein